MKLPPQETRKGPSLVLVGIDFRHAPLELRERISLSGRDEIDDAIGRVLSHRSVEEAYLLSTCNRTEVYALPRNEEEAYRAVVDEVFDTRAPGVERQGRLYVRWHEEAAEHLLSVACGLESMVLGEPEILGQVKQAAELAVFHKAAGPVLKRLLKTAQDSGRRARSETELSVGAVSFGYASVELARNIFSHLETTRVLLIGAGEIARQVARNLRERGAKELVVANRSAERAESLLLEFPGAQLVPFDDRVRHLAQADLAVVSTSADQPVITRAHVEEATARRGDRPLLLVDLSVPRNVA
ncbi:MAG: glutamyl-tRNA reductase, partial [Acidobacteria bacterium]|nr:glutamyl-tRNA reductase [Acidobacteriota bacterium]